MLERLASQFNCGKVRVSNNRNSAEWVVTRYADIRLIIIPFLDKYPLIGVKAFDLKGFKKAVTLMDNKVHLTKEGFAQFKAIKDAMYKGSL